MSSKSKLEKRINGGFAIYYGVGSLLASVGSFIGLIVWGFKVLAGTEQFRWVVPVLLIIFIAISGFVSYLLLRVGYEEIED